MTWGNVREFRTLLVGWSAFSSSSTGSHLHRTVICVFQVISGHQGWVRCIDVEPGNEWFVTGSADRMIKVCFCLLRLDLVLHF